MSILIGNHSSFLQPQKYSFNCSNMSTISIQIDMIARMLACLLEAGVYHTNLIGVVKLNLTQYDEDKCMSQLIRVKPSI